MKLEKLYIRNRAIPSLVLMVMIAAFALKAVLPAGFMPESKNGFIEMVICSGMGEKTIFITNDDTKAPKHQSDKTAKDICAYQILASGKGVVPESAYILSVPSYQQIAFIWTKQDNLVSIKKLSFGARGPPTV